MAWPSLRALSYPLPFSLMKGRDLGSPYWKFIRCNQGSYRKPESLQKDLQGTKVQETKKETKKINTITERALAITLLHENVSFWLSV